jgi:hypothetical protein
MARVISFNVVMQPFVVVLGPSRKLFSSDWAVFMTEEERVSNEFFFLLLLSIILEGLS